MVKQNLINIKTEEEEKGMKISRSRVYHKKDSSPGHKRFNRYQKSRSLKNRYQNLENDLNSFNNQIDDMSTLYEQKISKLNTSEAFRPKTKKLRITYSSLADSVNYWKSMKEDLMKMVYRPISSNDSSQRKLKKAFPKKNEKFSKTKQGLSAQGSSKLELALDVDLILLGTEGSGKTTLLKTLSSGFTEEMYHLPRVNGTEITQVMIDGFKVKVRETGWNFVKSWPSHYNEAKIMIVSSSVTIFLQFIQNMNSILKRQFLDI